MRSKGYGGWYVCVCVCVCVRVRACVRACVCVSVSKIWYYRHQTDIRAIPSVSARQARENVCVASAKSAAFDLKKPPGSKDWLRDPAH